MIASSSPYFLKQLKIAFEIIDAYSFNEPFHIYLKRQFQQHKNWGSKDRKNYRNICYSILRNFPIFKDLNSENRIKQFLAISDGTLKLNAFDELSNYIDPSLELSLINQSFNQIAPVFFVPYSKNNKAYNFSSLPGYIDNISETNTQIFDGSSNLDSLVANKLGYIQDFSSTIAIKKIAHFCEEAFVWDACSASGGKSLSILNFSNPQKHHCSDVRPDIIKNLVKRFELSPFEMPITSVIDARRIKSSNVQFNIQKNIIVADLPCSGSGNWRRNPENRWTFTENVILKYQELQRSIFTELYSILPVGGYIYYMTCSIFKAENQENIDALKLQNPGLEIIFQEYLGGKVEGYENLFSDYIFGCLIEKTQ